MTLAAPASTTSASSSTSTATLTSASATTASTSSSSSSPSSSASGSKSTSSGHGVTITVKNSCSSALTLHKLDNAGSSGNTPSSAQVGAGSSHEFQVSADWSGRVWGCEGGDCPSAVSLAEFLFSGYGGKDFYDISFVDGFNLPLSITPEGGSGECKSPTCASLPTCPDKLKAADGSCKSACAAFGTPEYCCTGEYNSPEKCKASQFADAFKKSCQDAYSFAYDDETSTFGCTATKYTVTFCPSGGH